MSDIRWKSWSIKTDVSTRIIFLLIIHLHIHLFVHPKRPRVKAKEAENELIAESS
jgi:hypothetical protein